MIEAYPLCWPDGWPRKHRWQRSRSRYEVDFAKARDHLVHELALAGGRHVVIWTNVPLRRDGLPLAGMRQPEDPGVAVYWDDRKGRAMVLACDVWETVRENLRAVGLAVEAIRSLERTGSSEVLERAFSGYARLPAGSDHWSVLGLPKGSGKAALTARLRELAHAHHPDRGGDPAVMASINAAYGRALEEVGS